MSKPTEISLADRSLLAAATTAARNAYAPYSKFRVGAALRTVAGGTFSGCNVENASYGLTICAERSAIFTAVAAEGAAMRIAAIAIHVDSAESFPPCGACRQVIAEFALPEAVVLFAGVSPAFPVRTSIGVLLPQPFRL